MAVDVIFSGKTLCEVMRGDLAEQVGRLVCGNGDNAAASLISGRRAPYPLVCAGLNIEHHRDTPLDNHANLNDCIFPSVFCLFSE